MEIIKENCLVCQREFDKLKKPTNRRSFKTYRKSNSCTCSKRCSVIYNKIHKKINSSWYNKLKRSGIKLEQLKK